MTLEQLLEVEKRKPNGLNLHRISQRTGIAYTTLFRCLRGLSAMSVPTARKLEAFDARLSAAELLGLKKGAA